MYGFGYGSVPFWRFDSATRLPRFARNDKGGRYERLEHLGGQVPEEEGAVAFVVGPGEQLEDD